MLILAGVTIVTLTGDNSLLKKAADSNVQTTIGEEKEKIRLAYNEYRIKEYTDAEPTLTVEGATNVTPKEGGGWTVTFASGRVYDVEENGTITGGDVANSETTPSGEMEEFSVANLPIATPGTATTANSKYEADNKTAVIPAGYTVSNESTEQSIDNGLVIKKGNNEWVWIPVSASDVVLMYSEDSTGWTLCGTSGDELVVTKYKSNARTDVASDLTRTTPGTTTTPYYREPDIVVGDGTQYDAVADNRKAAGFIESDGTTASSLGTMARALKDDYKKMIDSVKKYGGFYIGRYELGGTVEAPILKQNQVVLESNWYNIYKACKLFGDNGTESRMIWGCQWDQVCNFIHTSGDKVSLTNSTTYGNYFSAIYNYNLGEVVTGYNNKWKTNNIYDLAGNYWEWTQEATKTDKRVYRSYNNTFMDESYCGVADRGSRSPTGNYSDKSSRPVLYIK